MLSTQHPPIGIKSPDGKIIPKIYYGDSDLVQRLDITLSSDYFALLFIIVDIQVSVTLRKVSIEIFGWNVEETAHQLSTNFQFNGLERNVKNELQ